MYTLSIGIEHLVTGLVMKAPKPVGIHRYGTNRTMFVAVSLEPFAAVWQGWHDTCVVLEATVDLAYEAPAAMTKAEIQQVIAEYKNAQLDTDLVDKEPDPVEDEEPAKPTFTFTDVNGRDVKFISIYKTSRHVGGAEEGGWWYDWYDYAHSSMVVPADISMEAIEEIRAKLLEEHKPDQPRYNRFSAANHGEPGIMVVVEDHPGEYQSTKRPHYE